jgi:hypothetical protein
MSGRARVVRITSGSPIRIPRARRWRHPRVGSLLAALAQAALIVLGGCREYKPLYPNTNLGGFVFLDGIPVPDGMIAFVSEDPKLGHRVVTPIVRGRYIADEVPLGSVRVYFSSLAKGGEDPKSPRGDCIPAHYDKGIELTVGRGMSEVNFPLRSEPPRQDNAPVAATPEEANAAAAVAKGADDAAVGEIDSKPAGTVPMPGPPPAEPNPEP